MRVGNYFADVTLSSKSDAGDEDGGGRKLLHSFLLSSRRLPYFSKVSLSSHRPRGPQKLFILNLLYKTMLEGRATPFEKKS